MLAEMVEVVVAFARVIPDCALDLGCIAVGDASVDVDDVGATTVLIVESM